MGRRGTREGRGGTERKRRALPAFPGECSRIRVCAAGFEAANDELESGSGTNLRVFVAGGAWKAVRAIAIARGSRNRRSVHGNFGPGKSWTLRRCTMAG